MVLQQLSVFGRFPEAPRLLRLFHPVYEPILKQCPHAPICFGIRICGAEEHRIRDRLERKLHVVVRCRVHRVISTCSTLCYRDAEGDALPGGDMSCTVAIRIPLNARTG